jgi:hypothetical protein
MVTTYVWADTRDHANTLFHETPGAALEERILTHFREHPAKVVDHIDSIAIRVAEGKINHGWAILDRELATIPADVTITDTAERLKQLRLAETWIRNTGGYINRLEELDSELYDEHLGRLRHWPDTRQQIHALWHEQRFRFRRTERQAYKRQRRQALILKRIRPHVSSQGIGPLGADQHALRIANEVTRATLGHYDSDPHYDDYIDNLAQTVDLDQQPGDLE